MFKAPPRPARWTAVLLLPLLLVAACGAEKRSTVPADRIVGTWTAADGEEMSFAADRSFTSSGLDSRSSPNSGAGQKATGTWRSSPIRATVSTGRRPGPRRFQIGFTSTSLEKKKKMPEGKSPWHRSP
ncbi:hypothetical protein [Streptomyces echinatus]|uniref:hypothetical protein n=1 Tax=Streptomyces echinatus TaxID=67293 RepID=UPI0031F18467